MFKDGALLPGLINTIPMKYNVNASSKEDDRIPLSNVQDLAWPPVLEDETGQQ